MTIYIVQLIASVLVIAWLAQSESLPGVQDELLASPLFGDNDYICSHPPYKVHLLQRSPLVVYLEGFVTPEERSHLIAAAEGDFDVSRVVGQDGESEMPTIRLSQSASLLPDVVVNCIEERALQFQGYNTSQLRVEDIQLVRYGEADHFNLHIDWFEEPELITATQGGNRASSFFGYIQARDVIGGGTNFPLLDAPEDQGWCGFIDCDQPYDAGLTFRPIEGNVIYWENLLPGGTGDYRVLHAGLPVVTGQKIGMNIWTRQEPFGTG